MNRRIVLTSALTDPKKIKSHLRGEGIWIYAGKDINRFNVFKKTFGQKINHASPAGFQEFISSNRHAFVQWTEEVHLKCGHDLTHWLSDTFSSNPYMSNLFCYCMNLAWFKAILKEHPGKDIVFVSESRALLSIGDVIAYENIGSNTYKYGFKKENIRFFYQIGRSLLDGYKSLAFLFIKYIYACVYKICRTDKELKNISVIVDTFVSENSFDKEGRFVNRYFSELHELLCKTEVSVGVLAIFYKISFGNVRHVFKKIYQSNTRFILLEDFLKPIDYFKTLAYPLKRLMCFERVQDFLGIKIQPLINEENWVNVNSSNFILSLLANKLPKRICESGMNPSVYINWSENQTIHKAIISGMHKYFSKTKVIGGKPFLPPLNHLNLFNTESERHYGYAPDRIVTCGKKLKNIFSAYDKDRHYDVGASFRYGYLRKLMDNNHIHPGDIGKHKIISVLLSQIIPISRHVLTSSTRAIHNAIANGWEIRIKMHPTLTKSDMAMLLKEYDIKSDCIELTFEDMESLLPKSAAILTSEGGVAVEAICLGIPVVSVGMPIGLDFNVLGYLPSSMWRLAFTDEEVDMELNKWALRHPLSSEEREKIGRKVLMEFIENNTNKSLQVYLESLDNTK